MRTLSIDIETYSDVELTDSGAYPYTESEQFEILLFAYAFDEEPVSCIDLTWDDLPPEIENALTDPDILKTAFNANFEITCIIRYFNLPLKMEQWECTMVRSLMLGLPGSLEMAAKVLKLDVQKDAAGKALIKYFSKPCRPSKANGNRTRNLPHHDPEKWQKFIDYCIRDVETERAVKNKLLNYLVMTIDERNLWLLDQQINNTGARIDRTLVRNAIECDRQYTYKLMEEARELTGLDNPNSVAQLKDWLKEQTGTYVSSLTKETVPALIEAAGSLDAGTGKRVRRLLQIRQELAKTSVKKYLAMEDAVCKDDRVRGLLAFYGANRTGRWAGRLVQVQNLPKNEYADLDLARNLLREGRYEDIELLFDKVPNVLSQLIRTAFIASEDHRFIVADFSAIEARVIAWVADEDWRLEVFRTHGKIYEASASQMFKVPIGEIGKGSPLRQKGKIAELALGYGGGAGALEQMGALEMGLEKEELQELVDTWRKANPNIIRFWRTVNTAALKAVREQSFVQVGHDIAFEYYRGILFIRLPSGRKLSYVNARIGEGKKFGNDVIKYEGMNQTTKQWSELETYGGKLTENIVQAIARDCLAFSMVNAAGAGYDIVMHVHDEIIADCEEGRGSVEDLCRIMGQDIPWAQGLPLRADGYETSYYRKD